MRGSKSLWLSELVGERHCRAHVLVFRFGGHGGFCLA
jgi:hypothetical protein